MVEVETESDIYSGGGPGRGRTTTDVLYVAFRGNAPLQLPSRHVVDDIDVVQFGRGDVAFARADRRLAIQLADPLMSTTHGQLSRVSDGWRLDDPSSKNGALVGGVRTRSIAIAIGQVFALGHALFVVVREDVGGAPLDLEATALRMPHPALATFEPALAAAFDRMARVAATELPVLLLGETGTGKEVTARALHELSRRRGAFVAVNCGAIAPTLVESELFGHRRGAFSGATSDKPGYIRTADQGTLFLDEIGELPLPAQAALLRVLQEREVVPVGDAMPVPVDLRVCAATHRNLPALVANGQFREDLYARLLGVTITLPPLHARRVDLGLLIPRLLRRITGFEHIRFTPAAAMRLFEYDWPRNVRELERALAVMAALAGTLPIGTEHVPEEIRARGQPATPLAFAATTPPIGIPAATPQAETRSALTGEEHELKQRLEELLIEHDHNLSEVARKLGKDRTQIYRWVRRFGIAREGS